MKKIIIAGNIASGKTTICQYLNDQEIRYKKTQSIELINCMIDTPGEYFEHRSYLRALTGSAGDTEIMIFVLDPTQEQNSFRPGLASTFSMQVIGVISKTDIASTAKIERGREVLRLAGAEKIFAVSAFTGNGMAELAYYLSDE